MTGDRQRYIPAINTTAHVSSYRDSLYVEYQVVDTECFVRSSVCAMCHVSCVRLLCLLGRVVATSRRIGSWDGFILKKLNSSEGGGAARRSHVCLALLALAAERVGVLFAGRHSRGNIWMEKAQETEMGLQ